MAPSGSAYMAAGQVNSLVSPAGQAGDRTVTSVTGEKYVISAGARGLLHARPAQTGARSKSAGVVMLSGKSSVQVIPTSAVPFLGRGLDLRLFDLAAVGAAAGEVGRIPVRFSYSGSRVPTVSGVTVTSSGNGTAVGYLSAPAQFGSALAGQAKSARSGAKAASPFPGVTSLTLDRGTDAPAPVKPQYAMSTLTMNVTDHTGAPAQDGVVSLMNADECARYAEAIPVIDGVAKASVPVGTYLAITVGVTPPTEAGAKELHHFAVSQDVRVSGEGKTLAVDLRRARQQVSVRTPRPATEVQRATSIVGTDAKGKIPCYSNGNWVMDDLATTFLAPAPKSRVGALASTTQWTLGSPKGGEYNYFLNYPAHGIEAKQAQVVTTGEVATVQERIWGPFPEGTQGDFLPTPTTPGIPIDLGGYSAAPFPVPGATVTYLRSAPGTLWSQYLATFVPDSGTQVFSVRDRDRSYPVGRTTAVDWNRPMHNSKAFSPRIFHNDTLCAVCRTPEQMTIGLAPFGDSTPGHQGEGGKSRVRLLRDGVTLVEGQAVLVQVPVPAELSTYAFVQDVDRTGQQMPFGHTLHSEVTFRSGASTGAGLPVLVADVSLETDQAGRLPQGASPVTVTVHHADGAKPVAITKATFEWRLSDSEAWRSLRLFDQGKGVYAGTFSGAPGLVGQPIDIRITAADAAGGALTQTVLEATAVTK